MKEPTVEQIAMMAAAIYSPAFGEGIRSSVRSAIKIWDEAARQIGERNQIERIRTHKTTSGADEATPLNHGTLP